MKKATTRLTGIIALLLVWAGTSVAQVNVTFRVNSATFPDTLMPSHVVQIRGDVSGGSQGGETPDITWDAASATMTNAGGDYWTATVALTPGDTLNYKYWAGYDANTPLVNKFGGANEEGWEAGGDRQLIVPDSDTTLAWAWMGHTTDAVQPWEDKQDTVAVFFRVNVGARVQQGLVVPANGDSVQVRGGTPPLTWGNDTPANLTLEEHRNGDNYFYSGAVYFAAEEIDSVVFYKFFAKDWEGDNVGERGSGNRNFDIPGDTTIAWKFFNDEVPSSAVQYTNTVSFRANAAYLTLLQIDGTPLFSEQIGDRIVIRGGGVFGGWSADADDANALAFDDENFFYFLNKNLTGPEGSTTSYKYYVDYDESRLDDTSPNYLEAYDEDQGGFGYEEPLSVGGGNRIVSIVGEQNATQNLETVYFNDVPPAGVIQANQIENSGTTMSVTFRVDMTDAMSAATPMAADDSVFFVFESKLTALTQNILPGDGPIPADPETYLMTKEDGSNVYTYTMDLQFPALNDWGFRVAYGKPRSDGTLNANGGGFDQGRRWYQYVQPVSVADGGVDPVLGQIYVATWPATFSMPVLTWQQDQLPIETPLDYAALASSNEDVGVSPEGFSLSQNYPNPFNPSTNFTFNLPVASEVNLEVFNLLGQKVATVVNGQTFNAGTHTIGFDASRLASGMYLYRVTAGNFVAQRKMTLIK